MDRATDVLAGGSDRPPRRRRSAGAGALALAAVVAVLALAAAPAAPLTGHVSSSPGVAAGSAHRTTAPAGVAPSSRRQPPLPPAPWALLTLGVRTRWGTTLGEALDPPAAPVVVEAVCAGPGRLRVVVEGQEWLRLACTSGRTTVTRRLLTPGDAIRSTGGLRRSVFVLALMSEQDRSTRWRVSVRPAGHAPSTGTTVIVGPSAVERKASRS